MVKTRSNRTDLDATGDKVNDVDVNPRLTPLEPKKSKKRKSQAAGQTRKAKQKKKDSTFSIPSDFVDTDLLVPKVFDAASFSPSSQLFVGNIFALFGSDNSVTALYQAVNPVAASLVVGTGLPRDVAIPAAPQYMVLSQNGFSAAKNFRTPVEVIFALSDLPSLSILSVLSPKSQEQPSLASNMKEPVKRATHRFESPKPSELGFDVDADAWDSRKEKFRDGVGFRVVCFNVEAIWSSLAGPGCSLDSVVSLTTLRAAVPLRLRSLPVCDSKVLGAFARLMFAEPSFKISFPRPEKKEDSIHLGHLLYSHEKFTSVSVIRLALSRLVTLLGAISTFPDEWSNIFALLTKLLDVSTQWNVTDWDVRYVFKFVHGLLGQLSSTAVACATRALRKDELVVLLGSVFEVDYSLELSMYLAEQRRYDSFSKSRQSSTTASGLHGSASGVSANANGAQVVSTAGGGGRNLSNVSAAVKKRDGWCIQHAAVQLKVSNKPCDASCGRPHPQLSTPLTPSEKTTLRGVAGSIKDGEFKRKFLAMLV
jgi:hypothetical protein